MAKQTVEFTPEFGARVGDTNDQRGVLGDASIAPLRDGEEVVEYVLNRPLQVLRMRTEVLRKEVADLKYLADADRAMLLAYDGKITVPEVPTRFSLQADGVMRLRPFISPGAVSIGAWADIRSSIPGNYIRLRATNKLRAYGTADSEGSPSSNSYTLTAIEGAEFSVAISGDPLRHITITFSAGTENDPGTGLDDLVAQINGTAALSDLGVHATRFGSDTAADAVDTPTTYFQGGLDAELHVITAGAIESFFSASADNLLQDGDTLAVAYSAVVGPGNGGRRQSIDNSPESNADVSSNLVNLRVRPEMAHLSLPLCTRDGSRLVFIDGTVVGGDNVGVIGGSQIEHNGGNIDGALTVTGKITAPQFEATTTDDPPLIVASDKQVLNLNASYLEGLTWGKPGEIGKVTPNTGKFTTVNATSLATTEFVEVGSALEVVGNAVLNGDANQVNGALTVSSPTLLTVPMTVKGTVSQGANLQEWCAENGTPLAAVGASGNAGFSSLTVSGATDLNNTANIRSAADNQVPLDVYGGAAQSVDLQRWYAGTQLRAAINQNGDLNVTHIYNGLDAEPVRIDDALAVSNAATFDGALTVSGTTTLNGAYTNVNGRLDVKSPADAAVPLEVYGTAGQTADIQRWYLGDSLTTHIDSAGNLVTPILWTNVIDGPGTAGVTIDDPLWVNGGVDIKPTTNVVALDVTAGKNASGDTARPQQWRDPNSAIVAYIESDGDFHAKSVTVTTDIETPTLWVNTIDSRGAGVTVNDPLTVSGALTAPTATITTVNATTLNATTLNATTIENPNGPTVSVTDSLNVTENVTLNKDLSVGDDLTVGAALTVTGSSFLNSSTNVSAQASNYVPLEVFGKADQSVDLQRWYKDAEKVASIDRTGALITPNVWTNAVESQGTLNIGAQSNTDAVVIGKSGGTVTVNGALIQTRTRMARSGRINMIDTTGDTSETIVNSTVSLYVKPGDLLRVEVLPELSVPLGHPNAINNPSGDSFFSVGYGEVTNTRLQLELSHGEDVLVYAHRIYTEDREADGLPVIVYEVPGGIFMPVTARLKRILGALELRNWSVVITIL